MFKPSFRFTDINQEKNAATSISQVAVASLMGSEFPFFRPCRVPRPTAKTPLSWLCDQPMVVPPVKYPSSVTKTRLVAATFQTQMMTILAAVPRLFVVPVLVK